MNWIELVWSAAVGVGHAVILTAEALFLVAEGLSLVVHFLDWLSDRG